MKNYRYTFLKIGIFCLLPFGVFAEDDIDIPGDGGDPAQAPISYYWWVLVLVAVLYVWKSYYKNHPLAASKE